MKFISIKEKVENILHVGSIYPIPLSDWVSKIPLIIKKQGMIWMCVDYQDINRACPKDNYPTYFINQIVEDFFGNEIL